VEPDSGGGSWLWLEDVAERRGPAWSRSRYAEAAAVLGAWNGAYLAERALPACPWLSRGWLRSYVDTASRALSRLEDDLAHPLVRRLYPGDSAARFLAFWAGREALLDALDEGPQVLCHLDANRRNLLAGGGADLSACVAVDWSFVGPSALGVDVAPLVVGSVLLYEADIDALPALEAVALNAYVAGLRRAGWRGDERDVWFAYAAAAALRYGAYGAVRVRTLLDERQHAWAEQVVGRPLPEFVDRLAVVRDLALARAEAAARATGRIGIERRLL